MRLLSLLAVGLVAVGASAQTTFRLVDPVLSVDGRRVASIGAPLVQIPFGVLQIQVPGVGTYTVSERPFAGARRAGQFDGNGLFFTSRGRTIRLYSREQILSLDGSVSAYVAVTVSSSRRRRGLAQLSVADAVDGRGTRSSASEPVAARVASGPRPSRSDRPAAAYLDQMAARDASERPRRADRPAATYLERMNASVATPDPTTSSPRPATSSASEDQLADDVDALTTERDRLRTERTQLADALARAEAERDRIDRDYAELRQRTEAAEAEATRAGALRSDLSRSESSAQALRTERDRLAAELDARDRSIAMLRAEDGDRESRMPAVLQELADTRRQLDEALDARDAAFASRDDAYALRDDALRARDDAQAEARTLRAEVERLRGPRGTDAALDSDLQSQRDALALDRLRLEADRAAFEADRDALQAERAAFEAERRAAPSTDFAERKALLDQIASAQAERQALLTEQASLIAERDRLADELRRLRQRAAPTPKPIEPAATSSRTASPPPPPSRQSVTVRTPVAEQDGAIATLPGFDYGRLQNPDAIRTRLAEAEYPHWASVGRVDGDVLVLFMTDASGRVVRTAVPSPIGGGLDALAEDLVREMRFVPPVFDGEPAGLRSQVLVRFHQ